jgi:hypothetical protein
MEGRGARDKGSGVRGQEKGFRSYEVRGYSFGNSV